MACILVEVILALEDGLLECPPQRGDAAHAARQHHGADAVAGPHGQQRGLQPPAENHCTRPGAGRALRVYCTNYGLAERGIGSSEAFSHRTGAGHVAPHDGLYHDCIHVKRNTLLLLISETFGGVNGRGIRYLTRLSHMARTTSDEIYLDRAGRVISFFTHFACALSSAAAIGPMRR